MLKNWVFVFQVKCSTLNAFLSNAVYQYKYARDTKATRAATTKHTMLGQKYFTLGQNMFGEANILNTILK